MGFVCHPLETKLQLLFYASFCALVHEKRPQGLIKTTPTFFFPLEYHKAYVTISLQFPL